MPNVIAMRGPRLAALAALAALLAACLPAAATAPSDPPAAPMRIVSVDYCADQFVLKLADRAQIAAVSIDAGRDFSYMRAAAEGLPQTRPRAEDVLRHAPDLVVRAYGGEPNFAALMQAAGVPVLQIGYAADFDGVRALVRDSAAAFGHQERGEALVADMDRRLAAAAPRAGAAPAEWPTALYVTPGGVTTGPGSLPHEALRAAGFANFEAAPGWRPLPLERLARERPDLIAAAFFASDAAGLDRWSAARHPIARDALRERPSAVIDGATTACGGWFLVDAVEALARARLALAAP